MKIFLEFHFSFRSTEYLFQKLLILKFLFDYFQA